MYLSDIAHEIRSRIPAERIPNENADELFLIYAFLVRAKGTAVTNSDVHDGWSAWMGYRRPGHDALVPYADLPPETAAEDFVFTEAIRITARTHNLGTVEGALFPKGSPTGSSGEIFELYKLMVSSSEALVSRRQGVNTFFITVNGALLTAISLVAGHIVRISLGAIAVALLSATGLLLCAAWRSLIISFGQLNKGKFSVINTMERYLGAAIYAAEWEALGRGEDPKTYRSFTSREVWVPIILAAVYALAGLVSLAVASGFLRLN